jgi:hypothetical protein
MLPYPTVVHTRFMPESIKTGETEAYNTDFLDRYVKQLAPKLEPVIKTKRIKKSWLTFFGERETDFNYCAEGTNQSRYSVTALKEEIEEFVFIMLSTEEMRGIRDAFVALRKIQRPGLQLMQLARETRETVQWIQNGEPPPYDPPEFEFILVQKIMAETMVIDILNNFLLNANRTSVNKNIGGSAGLEHALKIVEQHVHIVRYDSESTDDVAFYERQTNSQGIDRMIDALLDNWDDTALHELKELASAECSRLTTLLEQGHATWQSRSRFEYMTELTGMIETAIAFRRIRAKDSVETEA